MQQPNKRNSKKEKRTVSVSPQFGTNQPNKKTTMGLERKATLGAKDKSLNVSMANDNKDQKKRKAKSK